MEHSYKFKKTLTPSDVDNLVIPIHHAEKLKLVKKSSQAVYEELGITLRLNNGNQAFKSKVHLGPSLCMLSQAPWKQYLLYLNAQQNDVVEMELRENEYWLTLFHGHEKIPIPAKAFRRRGPYVGGVFVGEKRKRKKKRKTEDEELTEREEVERAERERPVREEEERAERERSEREEEERAERDREEKRLRKRQEKALRKRENQLQRNIASLKEIAGKSKKVVKRTEKLITKSEEELSNIKLEFTEIRQELEGLAGITDDL